MRLEDNSSVMKFIGSSQNGRARFRDTLSFLVRLNTVLLFYILDRCFDLKYQSYLTKYFLEDIFKFVLCFLV